MPRIPPDIACAALSKLDGRTKKARLVRSLRFELLNHVGEEPSITQRILIDQVCQLRLGIASMDSASDSHTFLEWNNSLAQLIQQIEQAAPNRKSNPAVEAA